MLHGNPPFSFQILPVSEVSGVAQSGWSDWAWLLKQNQSLCSAFNDIDMFFKNCAKWEQTAVCIDCV